METVLLFKGTVGWSRWTSLSYHLCYTISSNWRRTFWQNEWIRSVNENEMYTHEAQFRQCWRPVLALTVTQWSIILRYRWIIDAVISILNLFTISWKIRRHWLRRLPALVWPRELLFQHLVWVLHNLTLITEDCPGLRLLCSPPSSVQWKIRQVTMCSM